MGDDRNEMNLELWQINSPEDIRRLSSEGIRKLAGRIRAQIVETVSRNGGHLASSLGAVELVLALHTAFDTPKDKLVWDVGHQTYAHKLVTGRYREFHTLRQKGGLSGYLKKQESPYDVYDTGHASGSISFALGLAKARDMAKEDHHVVAIIGDGALTSGVAYEGLNNAGAQRSRLIVVLNDNSMSISGSVGGICHYLTALRLAPTYRSTKAVFEQALSRMPNVGPKTLSLLNRFKGGLKHFLFQGGWFEFLGFQYYGPIDGHDVEGLRSTLEEAKKLDGPVLVHVVTSKGKGYAPAEARPEEFHGPGPFDPVTGQFHPKSGPPSWNEVFGRAMCHFAGVDKRIVAITAAMSDGTGLSEFRQEYPDRFFDVGIAESHAVTFAAGLAQGGLIPVVAIYSTFLQRAFDQIIQDVCLQGLKVVFAIDRAGIVGEDGETHHGEFDLSYLRLVPGLTVMAPKDERELVNMLHTALQNRGPCAVRYPRGEGQGVPFEDALKKPEALEQGRAEILSVGQDVNLVAIGSMVFPAQQAARMLGLSGVSCGVVNARYLSPLDQETVVSLVSKAPLAAIEENVSAGGLGDAVLEAAQTAKNPKKVVKIAIPQVFLTHGTQGEIRRAAGLDPGSIVSKVQEFLR